MTKDVSNKEDKKMTETVAQFVAAHKEAVASLNLQSEDNLPDVAADNMPSVMKNVLDLAVATNEFVPMLDGEDDEYEAARFAINETSHIVELASNAMPSGIRKQFFSVLAEVSQPVLVAHDEAYTGHGDRKRRQFELA